jgi:outer membrane protein assembly factor BamB
MATGGRIGDGAAAFPPSGHRLDLRMSPPPRHPILVGSLFALGLAALSLLTFAVLRRADDGVTTTLAGSSTSAASTLPGTSSSQSPTSSDATTSSSTTTTTEPLNPWVDVRTVGQPWGDTVTGLLTFRGNPTNSWYGTGPVPTTPEILWRYPDSPMCSQSTDLGNTATWCGNGWTGQPVVWERSDGITELMFGGYDRKFHFVDAATGENLMDPIVTGDLVKGSPTLDPDGYPLVYFGSRDNYLRIVALDGDQAEVLWKFQADLSVEGRWNDDWDGAPRIVNDILFEGGENSIFYAWKLNRSYGPDGKVTVDPVLLFKMASWNDQLLAELAPSQWIGPRWESTSIEDSVVVLEGRVYFGNSGGRVLGLDITNIEQGVAPVVLDFWVGDDIDASIVADTQGMLYVASEVKRHLPIASQVGQLIKLDPSHPDDPFVWGAFSETDYPYEGGFFSTPALGDGVIYAASNKGYLTVFDQETGEELWHDSIGSTQNTGPVHMASPVVVGGKLLLPLANGYLRCYDLTDPRNPVLDWEFKVGDATLEATPAVWNGTIYLASRDGYLYAIGE